MGRILRGKGTKIVAFSAVFSSNLKQNFGQKYWSKNFGPKIQSSRLVILYNCFQLTYTFYKTVYVSYF